MNILPEFTLPVLSLPQSITDLVALAQRNAWERGLPPGLDLGDGQQIDAADVLEGHFFRLAQEQNVTGTGAALPRYAYVQTDLGVAIASLAPHLSPFIDVAEEVAQNVPPTNPSPQFRSDLHRALEREHQQQGARRTLAAQQQKASLPLAQRLRSKPLLFATVSILLCLFACFVWLRRSTNPFAPFLRSQVA